MILTTVQAREKLCCMEMGRVDGGRLCNGNNCMAWRWFDPDVIVGKFDKDEEYGYCGLAGQPMLSVIEE